MVMVTAIWEISNPPEQKRDTDESLGLFLHMAALWRI